MKFLFSVPLTPFSIPPISSSSSSSSSSSIPSYQEHTLCTYNSHACSQSHICRACSKFNSQSPVTCSRIQTPICTAESVITGFQKNRGLIMQTSPALWILKLIRALICFAGHSDVSVGIDDIDSSSPCSSPGDISSHEKDFTPTSEVMDESKTDGKVVRQLTQIIALNHISRINGVVPSANKETSDHERLKKRLLQNGFVEHQVKGDGNCQFRALSDQLYGTPEWYNCVRQHVVNQLKSHPERYKGYVPMAYDDYLKRMSMSGVWGDHVTLQAAADVYGVRVLVITSFKDTCFLEILPKKQISEKVVYLSFWAEVHYNSIHPKEESPHECCEEEEEEEEGVEVPIDAKGMCCT